MYFKARSLEYKRQWHNLTFLDLMQTMGNALGVSAAIGVARDGQRLCGQIMDRPGHQQDVSSKTTAAKHEGGHRIQNTPINTART